MLMRLRLRGNFFFYEGPAPTQLNFLKKDRGYRYLFLRLFITNVNENSKKLLIVCDIFIILLR
jgi:hypothetical protein